MSRYDWMIQKCIPFQSSKIRLNVLEIGTCKGSTASKFLKSFPCFYFGIDPFEDSSVSEIKKSCLSKKKSKSAKSTYQKLNPFLPNFLLIKGISSDILPRLHGHMDIIFIDGSHVSDEIRSDVNLVLPLCSSSTILFLDDFWDPIVDGFGSNFLTPKIIEFSPPDRIRINQRDTLVRIGVTNLHALEI